MAKKLTIIGIVLFLVAAGGGFGVWTMKQNAPSFRGYPIPVANIPEEKIERWEGFLKKVVQDDRLLELVVEQSNYAELMGVSAEDAKEDLKKRVQVEYKKRSRQIEVGATGLRKEDEKLSEVAKAIYSVASFQLGQRDPEFAQLVGLKSR